MESDPSEFGRNLFTGDLNRFLLNDKKIVESFDAVYYDYDPKKWKSAESLFYTFVKLAQEERKKILGPNFETVLDYLNVAQALDIEPNPHLCGKNYCTCPIQGLSGPNPTLSMLRAEAMYQLGM